MGSAIELDNKERQEHIPYLFVRGSNYQVGFSIGKSFRSLIEDFFDEYKGFRRETLPAYESVAGRKVYDECLALCTKRFPQYVQELEGMAAGARIPFHHLFLLHIEDLICPFDPEDVDDDINNGNFRAEDLGCKGCSSIISTYKPNNVILGHTEDALREMTNNFYIISAEITGEDGTVVEKFTSLAYPGQLPGYTMCYNDHGIIYSVNSLFPETKFPKRTPHLFIMRAALAARDLNQLLEIFRDEGCGTADGFSVNVIISDELGGSQRAYNVEVSPGRSDKAESEISVEEIGSEQFYSHCNSYLRCKQPEKHWFVSSSVERQKIIQKYGPPFDMEKIKEILSDEVADGEDKVKYSVFKRALLPDDHYATIVAGIFNVSARQWSLYKHAPNSSQPTAVIPIQFHRVF